MGNRDATGDCQDDRQSLLIGMPLVTAKVIDNSHCYIALLEPQRTFPQQTGIQMLQAVEGLLGVWGENRTTSLNIHELDAGMWRGRT